MIIKFRAWHKTLKQMRNINAMVNIGTDEMELEANGTPGQTPLEPIFHVWDMEDVVLMQASGIRDGNGRDIYDGDIMQLGKNTFVTKQTPGAMMAGYLQDEIVADPQLYDLRTLFAINAGSRAEIIGNIFENPELVERKGVNEN